MSHQPYPTAGLSSAFERAAQVHAEARRQSGGSRQIATAQGPLRAEARTQTAVEQAIASAAQRTSVDFDYLIAQAQVESAMDPQARARTSSATGLYQFIDSTWLGTMHRHGERFGLGNVAAQIGMTNSGAAYVSDPAQREAILNLRNDPQIASLMAAGLAEDNRAHLVPILGRQPGHGELYLAHFLGAGGAGRFLSAMASDPSQSAAELFRGPAAANRPVFYDRGGNPRSLAGVMDYLSNKLETARANAPQSMTNGYPSSARAPSLIADAAVSGLAHTPVMRGRSRPAISTSSISSLSPAGSRTFAAPPATGRVPMSDLLRSTFGPNGGAELGSGQATQQIRRAYDRLQALGL